MRRTTSLLGGMLLLFGWVGTLRADEPQSPDDAEVETPTGLGDAIEPGSVTDPSSLAPSAREQEQGTTSAPAGPFAFTEEPGTATIFEGATIMATSDAAFASENRPVSAPSAATPEALVEPAQPAVTAAPLFAPPEPALDAPTDVSRPRSFVSRKTFIDAAATTVMLATTISDPRHGSLQAVRGADGTITGWKIRAVSAKRYFGVCDDDDFAHLYDDRTVGMCTGFFVAPDLVLTAGHCVDAVRDRRHLRIVLDYAASVDAKAPRMLRPDQVLSVELEERGQGRGQDWALLRVTDAIAEPRIAPLCRPSDDCRGEEGIFSVSHPLGMPRKFLTNHRVLESQTDRIVTDLDTFVGSSGSPVFDRKTGRVLGMVISGHPDFRRTQAGCMRTAVVHRDATQRRGEIAMPIDRLPGTLALRILPWQSLRKRAALGSPEGASSTKKKLKPAASK